MNDELRIMNAMLRLARRRTPTHLAELLLRIDATPARIRGALSRLAGAGLVERRINGTARLTMAGFAIAVALAGRGTSRRAEAPRLGARRNAA